MSSDWIWLWTQKQCLIRDMHNEINAIIKAIIWRHYHPNNILADQTVHFMYIFKVLSISIFSTHLIMTDFHGTFLLCLLFPPLAAARFGTWYSLQFRPEEQRKLFVPRKFTALSCLPWSRSSLTCSKRQWAQVDFFFQICNFHQQTSTFLFLDTGSSNLLCAMDF